MIEKDIYIKGRKIAIRSLQLQDGETLGTLLYADKLLQERIHSKPIEKAIPGKEFLETMLKWCNEHNSISMAVLNNNDLAIGLISLSHINEEEKTSGIGYWFGSSYWGQGYGTEAFALVLNLARKMKLTQISSTVCKTNDASWRIWKKFDATIQEKDENKFCCTITLTPKSRGSELLQEYLNALTK